LQIQNTITETMLMLAMHTDVQVSKIITTVECKKKKTT